jgi:hypothetical protein
MNLDNPLFLVTFFSIFHIVGGLAIGKGIREFILKSDKGKRYILWGAIMGIPPLAFDWAFLIYPGKIIYGSIGPALFIIAIMFASIFLTGKFSETHEKSIGIAVMGLASLLIGLSIAPFIIKQALLPGMGLEDYIFSSCLLVMPILVGFGFLSNAVRAMLNNKSLDEYLDKREIEFEKKLPENRRHNKRSY